MELTKLNCTACGAPIPVVEGTEIIRCKNCGTNLMVERSEGYVALKLAEKISKAFVETSQGILENTQMTRTELQRIQLSNDLNAAKMQLSNIQTEIRLLERSQQNRTTKRQLSSLLTNEFDTMDRIRLLTKQLSTPAPDNVTACISFIGWEIAWINDEIKAAGLRNHPQRGKIYQQLTYQRSQLQQLETSLKLQQLRPQFSSFNIPDPDPYDFEKIAALQAQLEIDRKKARQWRHLPEGRIISDEIERRYAQIKQLIQQTKPQHATVLPPAVQQMQTASLSTGFISFGSLLLGLILELLVIAGVSLIGLIILGIAFGKMTTLPSIAISILFLILAGGIYLGGMVFFRRSFAAFTILGFFKLPNLSVQPYASSKGWDRIHTLRFFVGAHFLFIFYAIIIGLAALFAESSTAAMTILILLGIVAGLVLAVSVAKRTTLLS